MTEIEYSLVLYGKPKYNRSKDAPCLICDRHQIRKMQKMDINRIKAAERSEEEKKEKEGEENKPNSTSN